MLELRRTTVAGNSATGVSGLGIGGGDYLTPGGTACFDLLTSINGNFASDSNPDIFGDFTVCP